MISFWATFLDRKASIQGQTIHPITMWVAGHPLRLGTMPLGLRRRLHQPPQVCSEAFEEPLKVLFTLLGIFFFFLMEVDNMKPFTRFVSGRFFVFLFGVFTRSVFKDQYKTLAYFLPWKMLSPVP